MLSVKIWLPKIIIILILNNFIKTHSENIDETILVPPSILAEVQELFYDNEARGLIRYFNKSAQKEVLAAALSQTSSIITTQINENNRSKMLLHVMRILNSFHDHEKPPRFAILQSLSAEQIYYLIWRWRNAIYTSSYNGALERFMELLHAKNNNNYFFEMLETIDFEGLGTFLEAASAYNRLADIINFFNTEQQIRIADILLDLIAQEKSLDYVVTIVELMFISTNQQMLQHICQKIDDAIYKTPSENEPDLTSAHFFKLIITAYGQLNKTIDQTSEIQKIVSRFLQDNPIYIISKMPKIDSTLLFNEKKVHLQRHYFFGDTDGIVTFAVFQRLFTQDANWLIDEYPTYIKIHTKNPFTEIEVVILANRPRQRLEAEKHIQKELEKYGGGFHAFIFRGHSYNMHRVINDILPMTKIAFLGSCGGFENLDTILHLSKDAHIIYSKGTGTIWVNNTFLLELGNRLVQAPDIDWHQFKSDIRDSVAKALARRDIKDTILAIFDKYYIFPHENNEAIIIRKHMQMESDYPEILGYLADNDEKPSWLVLDNL